MKLIFLFLSRVSVRNHFDFQSKSDNFTTSKLLSEQFCDFSVKLQLKLKMNATESFLQKSHIFTPLLEESSCNTS